MVGGALGVLLVVFKMSWGRFEVEVVSRRWHSYSAPKEDTMTERLPRLFRAAVCAMEVTLSDTVPFPVTSTGGSHTPRSEAPFAPNSDHIMLSA